MTKIKLEPKRCLYSGCGIEFMPTHFNQKHCCKEHKIKHGNSRKKLRKPWRPTKEQRYRYRKNNLKRRKEGRLCLRCGKPIIDYALWCNKHRDSQNKLERVNKLKRRYGEMYDAYTIMKEIINVTKGNKDDKGKDKS